MQEKFLDVWDKTWRNKKGKIVIWQMPNAFLIGWVVFTFISLLINGRTADVFQWLGIISLLIWALLEIFKGVNYFRRFLGLVVMVFVVLSIVHII